MNSKEIPPGSIITACPRRPVLREGKRWERSNDAPSPPCSAPPIARNHTRQSSLPTRMSSKRASSVRRIAFWSNVGRIEPVGSTVAGKASATSRSAVSRKFVQATEHALAELLAAPLDTLDLVALLVDGVHFAEHCCVVALGIDSTGRKHPLALQEGSTENATLVRDLLVQLRDERGLDVSRPILVVIDGAQALRRAVLDVFDQPVIQRCQLHKLRNVLDKLPERLRETVARRMRRAYHADSALDAEAQLQALSHELERTHPGAAASLREGLAETLTVLALGVPPTLARTLRSTNAIESMIAICRDHSRNVKRWQDGAMVVRWCAAGMFEAKKQFRRVNGHLHLPALRAALDRHVSTAIRYKGDAA